MSLSLAVGMMAIGLSFSGTKAQNQSNSTTITCVGDKGTCEILLDDGTYIVSSGKPFVVIELNPILEP
mgnify:CR=1 FL=1